mgnify:CR=1 FL=1
MVLSLAPSVFAAEDDPGMSITFSNTTPNPGDTVTALITVDADADFSTALGYGVDLWYDTEWLTVEKVEVLGTKASTRTVGKCVTIEETNDDEDETIADNYVRNLSGDFARVTFKVSEYADGLKLTSRLDVYAWDSDYKDVVDSTKNYSLSVLGTVRPTATGYTVSMGADQQLVSGQKVRIPVTVASSEKKITGFNAYDMTFTYNPAALTLNTASDAAANLTVEDDNNGTVRVRRYGETAPLGEALTLDFTAKNGATSTVTLTGAKFDLDANSINFDAPDATITDAATVVNANNFTVTLPDDFTSDAETRLVPAGGSFTFKPVDSHYDYVFTVKVGDTVTEGQTFGEGGTYTVSDVNANVEVTVTSKTPKQYDVTYKYTRDNVTVDTMDEVIVGPAKATYNEDYSFSIRPRSDTVYSVRVILGEGKSSDDEKFPKKTSNADGTMSFTLDKYYVKQKFRVYVEATSGKSCDVEFKGNGAEDVDPSASNVVGQLNPYYFKLNKRQNCDYTITAIYRPHGGMLAVSRKMNVIETSDGQYMIPAPESLLNSDRWTLEITITKVSHNAEEVDVTTYLNLDGKTMMLVTVKGTPENGSAFTYDGNTMYKVEGYGTDWYAWLVILEKDQTLTKEDAAAKVAVSAADNVITIAKDGFDVNMTGVVDINDAQLVYDMYNGTYGDFGKVTMEKFLRADVNASKNVNSADAVVIVGQFR